MADASRFPRLALPFAITGAAAGWLSASLLANPLLGQLRRELRLPTAVVACVLAATVGALLRHWCAGRRYGYELVAPDPNARLPTDSAWRHAIAMVSVGTLTGTLIGGAFDADEALRGAVAGTLCALAFLPLGFAVLASARRAQRARLGSIVAASDRRAVWGILAALLGIATIEAAPDFAAWNEPFEALAMWAASASIVAGIFVVDERARRALAESVRDLEASPNVLEASERLDLGVGDELSARLERSASPYRGSERALALVVGDPRVARAALSRAALRGAASLVLLALVGAVYVAAYSDRAHEAFLSRVPAQTHGCFVR